MMCLRCGKRLPLALLVPIACWWLYGAGLLWGATFTVTTTADTGAGSLRQALLSANLSPGVDAIQFNVSGAGVRMIAPRTELPTITGVVTIDGTTQPGFQGTPLIQLLGSNTLN